jgi:hypothetical protein
MKTMKQQKISSLCSYVLSSSENMLDAVPGTLMLTECLDQCRNNDSCSSVNYETGLCVLFSSDADKLPGMVRELASSIDNANFRKVNSKKAQNENEMETTESD